MLWIVSNLSADCAMGSERFPWSCYPKRYSEVVCGNPTSNSFQHLHQNKLSCKPSAFCWGSPNHLCEWGVSMPEKEKACKGKNAMTKASKWQLKALKKALKEEDSGCCQMKSSFLMPSEEMPRISALVQRQGSLSCSITVTATDWPLMRVKERGQRVCISFSLLLFKIIVMIYIWNLKPSF